MTQTIYEPNIILTGGPTGSGEIPNRVRFVARPDVKVKILAGNRYEHFEPTAEVFVLSGRKLQVYVWSGSTKVAE